MYYIGTGKLNHGYRLTVVLDEDSRFVLGYAVGRYQKAKTKKANRYSELEKDAIVYANMTANKYGLEEVIDPSKSIKVSSFFSTLKMEGAEYFDYDTTDEFQENIDKYLKYYNFERLHSSLKYKTPYEVLQNKMNDH